MKIGAKIEFLRKSKGLTQEQLATYLEVSRQTIYKWEQSIAFPSLEKIKLIILFFNISYDDLLNDSKTVNIIIG